MREYYENEIARLEGEDLLQIPVTAMKTPYGDYGIVDSQFLAYWIEPKLAEKLYKVQSEYYHRARAQHWAENQYGDAGDN